MRKAESASSASVGSAASRVRRNLFGGSTVGCDAREECLGVLRARWQEAERLFRTAGPDAYERDARDIYALLREAWEKAIEEVLLNDVVERFRMSIQTQRVRQLHDIDEEDCDAIEQGMTQCSRWMRGHAESAADGTPFPKPAALAKNIKDLEDWTQRIRKRREGKKS
jgi:hypothetical protein